MTHWVEVLLKIVDGPQRPVSGVVRAIHADTGPRHVYDAHYGIVPSYVGFGLAEVRLLRLGRKTRMESLDGKPLFIADGEKCWVFQAGQDDPIETNELNTRIHDPGRDLIVSRPVEHWARPGFTRPTRPIEETEFIGRRAWRVELKTGAGGSPMVLTIDRETGAVLGQSGEEGSAAYVHCVVSEDVPDSTFVWTGAVRRPRNVFAEDQARMVERSHRTMQWFRDTITSERIQADVLVDFTPTEVRRHPEYPGSFEADFEKGAGRLWRRERSSEDWLLPVNWTRQYPTPIRAWSTQEFDWACAVDLGPGSLTDATVAHLQNLLHPGQEVVGTPPLNPKRH
ncbi:hypothetical protein HQ325_16540 [Rhodococcus sp. BP-349]|uniref:hypothetical protein n=1 Tax=unclassified Rhodococcus (in: high G+C Gram-positive bacteria) TaxID=192944 RepID=UPI001C9A895C|nr:MULTISPECIES: hypothetical protein [unclassified Rhodococcus (in: high G+C Gram-positive bacteria)]MBY6540284.1 hypothetical protein [Rhodococcus sp. BP-363]MBY6545691.1 hypothetical protein [Rhodococcus sp. BP-369]MBY6564921.1 hypothetical protein [Rhodococcus sp. BP-370]MBY6578143.1 hypothetical protein [Rhodococcus sp. BP-364]MBY6587444.1 hypothetical protein [Rhodococcus sp. BP-358]